MLTSCCWSFNCVRAASSHLRQLLSRTDRNRATDTNGVSVNCWFTTLFHILAHCCTCDNFGFLMKPIQWTLSYSSQSHGAVPKEFYMVTLTIGEVRKEKYNTVSLLIFHCDSIINVSCLTLGKSLIPDFRTNPRSITAAGPIGLSSAEKLSPWKRKMREPGCHLRPELSGETALTHTATA